MHLAIPAQAPNRLRLTAAPESTASLRRSVSGTSGILRRLCLCVRTQCWLPRSRKDVDLHSRGEAQLPIRHDSIARFNTRAERGDDLVLVEHLDLPHLCFAVLVDDKNVIEVLAHIEGVVRH